LDAGALVLEGNELAFRRSPDFEYPLDKNRDNVYQFVVRATNLAGFTSLLTEEVSVTNVAEDGISIYSAPDTTVRQGDTYRYKLEVSGEGLTNIDVTATLAPDWLTLQPVTNSIGNQLDTYELTGTAPTESLASENIVLSVSGNGVTVEQSFTITITDGLDPVIADLSIEVITGAEKSLGMIDASDNATSFSNLDFVLEGIDSAAFEVIAGELFFKETPDISDPKDVAGINIYKIIIRVSDEAGNTSSANYTIFISGDPSDPIPLLVNATDQSILYGDTVVTESVTYFGFVDGDDESVLTGELSFDIAQFSLANTYKDAIVPKGLTSDKYEITFNAGDLTVLPRPVSLKIEEVESTLATYGGTGYATDEFKFTYTFSGPIDDVRKTNFVAKDVIAEIESNEDETVFTVTYNPNRESIYRMGFFPSRNYTIVNNPEALNVFYTKDAINIDNVWYKDEIPDENRDGLILGAYLGSGFECKDLSISGEESSVTLTEGDNSQLLVHGVIRSMGTVTIPADATLICYRGIEDTGKFIIRRNTQSVRESGGEIFVRTSVSIL
ncbi:MAG: MBG domain-containing protein, partial [Cyclobacteriaceae bacterium]